MLRAWMRDLEVKFTSQLGKNGKTKQYIFGGNWKRNEEDLSIDVSLDKYMSTLKDKCVIKIKNLTYYELVNIVEGQFFNVEVIAGYRNGNAQTIFRGGVIYVSNQINDSKTTTAIFLCGSYMVATFGQTRLNLSLNSGINMYTAINFALRRSGITDGNISTQLKKQMISEIENITSNSANWIDSLTNRFDDLIVNSDSSVEGSNINIFNAKRSNQRVIRLTKDNILMTGGPPRLTNDGLELNLLPTFNFMCGDTVNIDNALIDISISSTSQIGNNFGFYLDKEGNYMILEAHYRLTNRSNEYSIQLLCKARSLISNFVGK